MQHFDRCTVRESFRCNAEGASARPCCGRAFQVGSMALGFFGSIRDYVITFVVINVFYKRINDGLRLQTTVPSSSSNLDYTTDRTTNPVLCTTVGTSVIGSSRGAWCHMDDDIKR